MPSRKPPLPIFLFLSLVYLPLHSFFSNAFIGAFQLLSVIFNSLFKTAAGAPRLHPWFYPPC